LNAGNLGVSTALFLNLLAVRTIHLLYTGRRAATATPTLLLVHGFGASTDHWRKNIAELRNDFEVWAIDLLSLDVQLNRPGSGDLWRDQLYEFITQGHWSAILEQLPGICVCVAASAPTPQQV